MTDRYKLICKYCDYTWRVDYPSKQPVCYRCKDTNIRMIDMARDSVDYYVGCPPFPERVVKKEEIKKEEPKKEPPQQHEYSSSSWWDLN